jgi:hypothetical protein
MVGVVKDKMEGVMETESEARIVSPLEADWPAKTALTSAYAATTFAGVVAQRAGYRLYVI